MHYLPCWGKKENSLPNPHLGFDFSAENQRLCAPLDTPRKFFQRSKARQAQTMSHKGSRFPSFHTCIFFFYKKENIYIKTIALLSTIFNLLTKEKKH